MTILLFFTITTTIVVLLFISVEGTPCGEDCNCPAGTYEKTPSQSTPECIACASGTYGQGVDSCTACAIGTDTRGKSGCKTVDQCLDQPNCPMGQTYNFLYTCTDCPVDEYKDTVGIQSCTYCPAGKNTNLQTGATVCVDREVSNDDTGEGGGGGGDKSGGGSTDNEDNNKNHVTRLWLGISLFSAFVLVSTYFVLKRLSGDISRIKELRAGHTGADSVVGGNDGEGGVELGEILPRNIGKRGDASTSVSKAKFTGSVFNVSTNPLQKPTAEAEAEAEVKPNDLPPPLPTLLESMKKAPPSGPMEPVKFEEDIIPESETTEERSARLQRKKERKKELESKAKEGSSRDVESPVDVPGTTTVSNVLSVSEASV